MVVRRGYHRPRGPKLEKNRRLWTDHQAKIVEAALARVRRPGRHPVGASQYEVAFSPQLFSYEVDAVSGTDLDASSVDEVREHRRVGMRDRSQVLHTDASKDR
jgi:hypothetical protein